MEANWRKSRRTRRSTISLWFHHRILKWSSSENRPEMSNIRKDSIEQQKKKKSSLEEEEEEESKQVATTTVGHSIKNVQRNNQMRW